MTPFKVRALLYENRKIQCVCFIKYVSASGRENTMPLPPQNMLESTMHNTSNWLDDINYTVINNPILHEE